MTTQSTTAETLGSRNDVKMIPKLTNEYRVLIEIVVREFAPSCL